MLGLWAVDFVQILTENVKFEVHLIPDFECMEVGMFVGVGNDGHREVAGSRIHDGQTDPVHANRTLVDHQVAEFGGEGKVKHPGTVDVFDACYKSGCVHMPLDEVAIHSLASFQAAFDVEDVACLHASKIGLFQRFIDGHNGVFLVAFRNIFKDFGDSETNPVMSNALIDLNGLVEDGRDAKDDVAAF